MSDAMKVRLQKKGDDVKVKVLINHPMETGQRKNPTTGKLIPAHYINQITVSINNKDVLRSRCSGGVSKNPFFGFLINNAVTNDKITVQWKDNIGESGSADATVA